MQMCIGVEIQPSLHPFGSPSALVQQMIKVQTYLALVDRLSSQSINRSATVNGTKHQPQVINRSAAVKKFSELIACESAALEQQNSIGLHGKTELLQLLVQQSLARYRNSSFKRVVPRRLWRGMLFPVPITAFQIICLSYLLVSSSLN